MVESNDITKKPESQFISMIAESEEIRDCLLNFAS